VSDVGRFSLFRGKTAPYRDQIENGMNIIEDARNVLKIEAEGILNLVHRIDAKFVRMVEMVAASTGRLIVGGIGKSGIVGRKIVATLNSTGTRSLFLHPVEAMHGDLGMVCPDDIFLALSNSGETDELNLLLPSIRSIGCRIIAFTGNPQSTLASHSDIVIDTGVDREACPLGLAPTASTTAQLAMGDALAVVLINRKHFKSDDFRRFHPGGSLGQRLAQRVSDIMLTGAALPLVPLNTPMSEAVEQIDRLNLGAVFVVGEGTVLAGIITDGDIRRAVARQSPLDRLTVNEIMTPDPLTIGPEIPAYDALNLMEIHQITILPIADDRRRVVGILHLHDILGKGAFKFNGGPT
jgi:arabinose-5-phosphate isomerase